jgi:myo-inositol-1(or 4)-monophosphatase
MRAMHPTLTIAVRAARKAGRIITRAAVDVDQVRVASKQANDFVTEVDQASEAAILEVLLNSYPDHSVLAEESGRSGKMPDEEASKLENLWIIDPLDGTTNFIHGLPHYSVSIALMQNGVVTQGLVYDPNRDELYTATRGRGAFVNDRRIRVSRRIRLNEALVGTGFPPTKIGYIDKYMSMLNKVMLNTSGVRRAGSAALDLAYVAAGRYDAFFEMGLSPWDVAAGSLLVTEAGGLCGDFKGEGNFVFGGQIVAAPPKIFVPMLPLLV